MKPVRNLYAVILAGGSGTRFWPMSREHMPKQFLDVTGKGSLLSQTLDRITPVVKSRNIIIVANKKFRNEIVTHLKDFDIPRHNILLEPEGRNTAPAICFAASFIQKHDPDGIMAVFPSDHMILHKRVFLTVLMKAVRLAKKGHLVTLGIPPHRPDTGYGYLKTVKMEAGKDDVLLVEKFTEKPDFRRARRFLKANMTDTGSRYYWNSGMFIWKSNIILKEFSKHLPEVFSAFSRNLTPAHIKKVYQSLPKISIDKGILEKAKDVVAVAAEDIGWSDLGTWESMAEVMLKDKNNNIMRGNNVSIECKSTMVLGRDRLIATIGLKDIIIIDTPDALLVCNKNFSQNVKDIVSILKKENRSEI